MAQFKKIFLLIYIAIPILIFLIASNTLTFNQNDHYLYLAYSFINGHSHYDPIPYNKIDLAYFNGKYFWPLGPFPSLVLMPISFIFKLNFHDWFLKIPAVILSFYLVYGISKKLNLSGEKSFWLATFFIFGSIYTPLAAFAISTYFSQIIATMLILLAIYVFLARQRWWLIGILIASGFLTRLELLPASIFFIFYLVKKPFKVDNFMYFILPIITSLLALSIYNYQRFGKFRETGLSYVIELKEARDLKRGQMFSYVNIPGNLYYMLIKTPDPVFDNESKILKFPYLKTDYWGLSVFFLSPVLFLIFKTKLKEKFIMPSILTSIMIMLPIITFYGIGYFQIGYRYALAFFPFLLFPLVSAFKRTNLGAIKILVGLSLFSTWFFIIKALADFSNH